MLSFLMLMLPYALCFGAGYLCGKYGMSNVMSAIYNKMSAIMKSIFG